MTKALGSVLCGSAAGVLCSDRMRVGVREGKRIRASRKAREERKG